MNTLATRHRTNVARRLHVADIRNPAERCMFWLAEYRRAREELADALRFPTEYGHIGAEAERDMEYAAAAFARDHAKMRDAIRWRMVA